MKAPPRRKGNLGVVLGEQQPVSGLNESPSKKEGKSANRRSIPSLATSLNESPSKKEGKSATNAVRLGALWGLNESPSKKEGKSLRSSSYSVSAM